MVIVIYAVVSVVFVGTKGMLGLIRDIIIALIHSPFRLLFFAFNFECSLRAILASQVSSNKIYYYPSTLLEMLVNMLSPFSRTPFLSDSVIRQHDPQAMGAEYIKC